MNVSLGFREAPEAWQRQLRAFGAPGSQISWLELVWHPQYERWIVYQFYPVAKTNYYVRLPKEPGAPELNIDRELVDFVQWEIYRTRGCYASPYWIIQGRHGGHRRRLWPYEATIAKLGGLPSVMPEPGDLPYAPFGANVMAQLAKLDQVAMYNKMLEYTDRNENNLDADEEEARVEILRKLAAFVREQTAGHVAELSRADLSDLTNQLPSGMERRGVKGHDFEQWFEEQLLPRQRIGRM